MLTRLLGGRDFAQGVTGASRQGEAQGSLPISAPIRKPCAAGYGLRGAIGVHHESYQRGRASGQHRHSDGGAQIAMRSGKRGMPIGWNSSPGAAAVEGPVQMNLGP